MSKSEDQHRKDLASLCIDLSHGKLLPGDAESLEKLMLDHPEVQDEYCLQVLLDLLLRDECGGANDTRPLLEWDAARAEAGSQASSGPAPVEVARRRESPASSFWSGRSSRFALAGVVAVVLAVIAIVASDNQHLTPSRVDRIAVDTPRFTSEQMELRNHDVTRMLYNVTNTSWSPEAEASSAETPDVTTSLGQGTAGLGKFNESDAGGYIVSLPPGAVLNLTVHADAAGENTLSVIGLDQQGQTTGEIVSFSNQANSASAEDNSTIYGRIGSWSELNDSPSAKFYLLTGLHHAAAGNGNMRWQVTDFRTFLELPHLLHIGWDDTDWTPKTAGAVPPDKDYDDITVTVSIERLNEEDRSKDQGVLAYSDREQKDVRLETLSVQKEYPFTILQGEGVILTVSSKAGYETELAVVEQASRKVWWSCNNRESEGAHLGVFVIDNKLADPVEFALVGRHRPTKADPWQASSFRRRLSDDASLLDRCQMIGFEDFGGDVGDIEDYNDIRVNMHWISL